MMPGITKYLLALLLLPLAMRAQQAKILVNHVGYEDAYAKRAVVVAARKLAIGNFQLVEAITAKPVYTGKLTYAGPVDKWKNRVFWALDFSAFKTPGTYFLKINTGTTVVVSCPFKIGKEVLEQATLSDVIYYFKGQRSSGLPDKADRNIRLAGKTDTVDAHGGWYDASGDYGKHLSHLTFSSFFNPQQTSLTAWTLFKTYMLLTQRAGTSYRQYNRRLLDEALYGADFLVRMQTANGSFYRSVSAPGPGKLPQDRVIRAEDQSYRIKQTKDQPFNNSAVSDNWRSYQVSFRSGGGLAIAALAMASTFPVSGDFKQADYLRAAEKAFAFLGKENVQMTNDGQENIIDDYTALCAATELYAATKKAGYKDAAEKRALQLIGRLASWGAYHDYWRADNADRPFFHPSDAGLPVTSLAFYYPHASAETQNKIRQAVRRSMQYELAITREVTNPFGYSRQLVQDTLGKRNSAFFFPHGSEAAPWWQGENARLGSLAAAAKLAAALFKDDRPFHDALQRFALDQLNWVLGLNPFDASMLQGTGRNNPSYGFFGTFEYSNAPGGIVNGITSGLNDEHDIDFNLSYAVTGKDYDWRWGEQWLPHAAWYLLAVSLQ
ncbi:glycoside hydrolase family 9 protein [Hufsiella ginkgonis]|uniref:Glycoside hydrolase n=1 Tax=Hufsiella ginkgonis TaxID=2695274 RepID=A0A7K1XZT7_9SPHI|nr:glycoside hydrolase family 9 protein [Hufsiella ginkgonis]MXV16452.1 glycoside hydrolase [Hufsiella ginkgonis]